MWVMSLMQTTWTCVANFWPSLSLQFLLKMRPEQSGLNVWNCNCIIVLHVYTSSISATAIKRRELDGGTRRLKQLLGRRRWHTRNGCKWKLRGQEECTLRRRNQSGEEDKKWGMDKVWLPLEWLCRNKKNFWGRIRGKVKGTMRRGNYVVRMGRSFAKIRWEWDGKSTRLEMCHHWHTRDSSFHLII